jgi:amidophosphoribosyltransferase
MCGIVGVVSTSNVNPAVYQALTVLQHRGQDAAGIATCHNGKFYLRKSRGLVRDVFHRRHIHRLTGTMGIGHVRYPTAGNSSSSESQPFYVNSPYGITLAHNGNLTNAEELRRNLFKADLRHMNTGSDSEALLNVFAQELQNLGQLDPTPNDIFTSVSGVHRRCRGGYAVVALINGYGLVGFRDPHGIRPIVFGRRETSQGLEYMVASESAALDVTGFTLIRDIAPGEAVYIDAKSQLHTRQCAEKPRAAPCIFEYVYFARPDSIMNGVSVYKARLRMGEKLAVKILRERPDHDIDVVIPIPDTSRTSALQLANKLGLNYREGYIKNRFIERTFIISGQGQRETSVRQKLNPIRPELNGKNVLLVDDSIVRGTTSRQIIQMARKAGAQKVYFASASPAVRYPNVYGIDMPTADELIAHRNSEKQVEKLIGADWLIYQDLEDLIASIAEEKPDVTDFDCAIFNGKYITGDIDQEYLQNLAKTRCSVENNPNDP